jgi:hypothetical protein
MSGRVAQNGSVELVRHPAAPVWRGIEVFASTMRDCPDAPAIDHGPDPDMYWDHMNGWGWGMMLVWSAV